MLIDGQTVNKFSRKVMAQVDKAGSAEDVLILASRVIFYSSMSWVAVKISIG
jgi:hypothetical protein